MDVTAVVTQEAGADGRMWWVGTVVDADGGGATQARRLDQLGNAVAEMVVVRNELPDDTAVVVFLDFSGVPWLDELVAANHEAEQAVETAVAKANATRQELARATHELTVRDLAVALGVSHQTAARIRRTTKVA